MAQRGQKDLIARLADAGEEALSRLASSPGMAQTKPGAVIARRPG